MIPAGAPPLHPARGIMSLDPKLLYNITPSVAALPTSLGALLLKQEQVSPSTMSLFRRRSYAPLSLVAIRACSSPFHDSSLILFRSGMPDRNNTNRVQLPCSAKNRRARNCSHLRARDFRMILLRRNAGNSIHIVKFRLCKSAEKNCSEAGSYYSGLAYEQILTCVRFCCHRAETNP